MPPETPEEVVSRLASLSHLEYDQVREAEAKRLQVRIGTLDKEVAELLGPPTLASRAIHIELRRKTASESVEPLRLDRLDHLEPLRRQAARWVADNAISLRSADPEMPKTLSGRAADNWRPLIAIADLAGGEWPTRARRIAQVLGSGRTEQAAGVMLLEDVQRIFADRGVDRLPSADMAETLSKMEDRPWPEWHQGKPITPRQIAKLLEPFSVTPGTIRTASGTAKGYKLHDFHGCFCEVCHRYIRHTVTDRSDHVVVPFGTDNHAWLHPECWPAWHEARRSQAIVALRVMGFKEGSVQLGNGPNSAKTGGYRPRKEYMGARWATLQAGQAGPEFV